MPRVAQYEIDRRRRAMTTLLRDRAYLPVTELCRKFKISEATARRDLVALSEQKTVVRTFGGAMADYDRRFAPFADRLKVAAKVKARIAAAAVSLLSPGMTVFLDAGTTVFAAADLLRRKPMKLRVVSNSLAVAERLATVGGIEMNLLGGRMLAKQAVLLGDETCRAASFYRFDLALLGAEGFGNEGVWNSTGEVVTLQRTVIGRAHRFAVCADAGKQGVLAPALLLRWDKLDLLITDADNLPVGKSHLLRA